MPDVEGYWPDLDRDLVHDWVSDEIGEWASVHLVEDIVDYIMATGCSVDWAVHTVTGCWS